MSCCDESNIFVFPAKKPDEKFPVTFDMSTYLASGETITEVVFTATASNPYLDPNASAILDGAPAVDGGQCIQLIQGGVNEVTYTLVCEITTSLGNIWEEQALLPVSWCQSE